MNTEDVTLIEAVAGLTRDLTSLHRQVDAACVEIRHLRAVNADLLAALKWARRELWLCGLRAETCEPMAQIEAAIHKAS